MTNFRRKIAQLKVLRKVFESRGQISYNRDKCIYCTLCEKTCPVNAITVSRKAKSWSIDHNICVRCTHCVAKCPTKALSLKIDL